MLQSLFKTLEAPVKIFGLQSAYGEKGNSEFWVGEELVKLMHILYLSSIKSLMWGVYLNVSYLASFFQRAVSCRSRVQLSQYSTYLRTLWS